MRIYFKDVLKHCLLKARYIWSELHKIGKLFNAASSAVARPDMFAAATSILRSKSERRARTTETKN